MTDLTREQIERKIKDIEEGNAFVETYEDQLALCRLALQAPQFQPADEVRFKIDLGVPFYLVEMKPTEPERYTIHSCFGSSAEDALARQVSTLQSKLAPPSDVVDGLVKALEPFAKEGGEPLWNEDDTAIQTRPSMKLDWRGGPAHFTVGDLRRAKSTIEAITRLGKGE